jgi:hypothetical protein
MIRQTILVTENTKYSLRAANPRAADRPVGDCNRWVARRAYHYDPLMALLFSVGLIMEFTQSVWGSLYEKMIKTKENKRIFDVLNKSIFLLCLDQRTSNVAQGTVIQNRSKMELILDSIS